MNAASTLSPELLRVFETVPDLYLILSPDLKILTASNKYLKATQKEREDIQGKHIFEVFPDNPALPDSDATLNVRHSLEWVLQQKKPHQMALQRYDVMLSESEGKFTEKYWLPIHTPVLDKHGDVLYIIQKVEDQTEQMQAKLQLNELKSASSRQINESLSREAEAQNAAQLQRNMLQALLDQAPVAMCLFKGPDMIIATVNKLMCQIWGRTAEEVWGKPLLVALPELNGQEFDHLIREVYNTGIHFVGQEKAAQIVRKGLLETNYYNFVYQPLHDEDGHILGVVNVAVDVTDIVVARKKAEEREREFHFLNTELATANQEISTTNEELHVINEELTQTKTALQNLNQELEERVKNRTQELQQAQSELEMQRNRLQELIMEAPVPICILNGDDFVYELVNPAYQQLLPGRRLLGNPMLDEALIELASQPFAENLREVYRTGETYHRNEEMIKVARSEGAPIENLYFNYTLQPRRSESGKVDGMLIYATDVTEQVVTRQAVERSAEQLRLITDSLPVLIGYLDKEERYQFANKAYEKWFTIKSTDLLGRTVQDIVGEKAYAGVKVYIERALAGERLDFKSKMPYREDFTKYIRTSYVPDIRNGKVEGFYTLVQDITEQEEARQKIEERERAAQAMAEELKVANENLSASVSAFEKLTQEQQRLVALIENSTDFIGLATPEGQGVYINPAGLKMLGLTQQQVEAVLLLDLFQEKDKHFVQTTLLPTLLDKGRWVSEYRVRHFKTGELIPVYYNSFTIHNEETGELLGLALIMIDITERKKQDAAMQAISRKLANTNAELRSSNEQLTRTNIDLDNFIYAASHDLKAPILNIEGLTQLLIDSLSGHTLTSNGLDGVTGMIQESIIRFKRTIDHLTEVTKLQKEHNQEAVLVNLPLVIREVQLDLTMQLEEGGVQLEIDLAACPDIRFSQKNMRSVVYNLISNAIKYASPERTPKIEIKCKAENEYTVLTVKDNGLGMDADNNPKLFTMFGRLHDHVEGSGIGLYMVKKIVENADGRIEVESEEGIGSTFRIYFKN